MTTPPSSAAESAATPSITPPTDAPATPTPGGIGPGAWLDRLRPHAGFIIVVLGLLLLLPGLGTIPLIDRDEPRFSQATREMLDRQDWIVPYFNDKLRFDKPPLTYWLMAASYAVFGEHEFGARFHSAVAAVLVALAMLRFGTRLLGWRSAFGAALAWLTCVQVAIHGRAAVADMPMVLCFLLATWGMYELLAFAADDDVPTAGDATPVAAEVNAVRPRPYPWRWFWLMYGALGVGFMAKGPIALAPLVTLVLFRFVLWRKPLPWSRFRFWQGALVVLAIVAPWGIPALIRTHGEFWQEGINRHVVKRGMTVFHGRIPIPGYYLATMWLSLFPWIALLPDGWTAMRRYWSRDIAFLAAWALGPFLIFSFYASQLPHYTMPAYPAVFFLLALTLRSGFAPGRRSRLFFWLFLGLAATLALIVGALAGAAHLDAPYDRLQPLALAAACGVFAASVGMAAWRLRLPWIVMPAILVAVGSVALFGGQLRTLVIGSQAATVLARANLAPGTECLWTEFREPSLVYYADHSFRNLDDWEDAAPGRYPTVAAFAAAPGPRLIVLRQTECSGGNYLKWRWQMWRGKATGLKMDDNRADFATLDLSQYQVWNVEGVNPARSTWVQVVIAYKPF